MAVLVGLLQIELGIAGNRSLKGKRRVLNSVKERVRSQFNVSIAEVELNDVWDAALLAVSCVANEAQLIHQTLSKVVASVERVRDITLVDYAIEIL